MPRLDSSFPVACADLSGVLIPQDGTKVAETVSHKIVLASMQNGRWLPDLQFIPKTVEDPAPVQNYFETPTGRLREINTGAAFEQLFMSSWKKHQQHIVPKQSELMSCFPEVNRSHYVYNNVVGRRIERFFDEAIAISQTCNLSGSDGVGARKLINETHREAYRGRSVEFDNNGTNTYWSYSGDAAFVHVYEKLLKVLPADSPMRKVFQAEIDHIFLKKFTPDGEVNEANIEVSLGLMMIDKHSRELVTINRRPGGEIDYGTVKGKIISPEDITFRRPIGEEAPRPNMVFDWNRDRMIGQEQTGWFGHCDIKATVDCLMASMHDSGGLIEFRSDSKQTVFLNKDLLLEALASVLEFSDTYVSADKSERLTLGTSHFGGARNDSRPCDLAIKTAQGYSLNLTIKLNSITKGRGNGADDNLNLAFSTLIPDDADIAKMKTFSSNPNITRSENGDINYINAIDRKISGVLDGQTFSAQGELTTLATPFSLNLSESAGRPILIGSREGGGAGKNILRYYYDPASKEITEAAINFTARSGVFVEQPGAVRTLGKISSLEIGREVESNDGVPQKLAMLRQAMSSGIKIAADHDTGLQVWNGEVHGIREDLMWKSADGKWEKIQLHVEGTFGKKPLGVVLHELNKNGEIVRSFEALAPVDFYWDSVPRVAPLIWGQNNKWYLNEGMLNRGLIQTGDVSAGINSVRYLYDLIHIGLNGKNGVTKYSIAHQGERLIYDNQPQWLADIAKVSGGAQMDRSVQASIAKALDEARAEDAILA